MGEDKDLYGEAVKMALRVEFLANSGELFLYANALYNAVMWGREIDKKNERIRKLDKALK